MNLINLRVVVYKDPPQGYWVARCLEYNIGAQSDSLDGLHTAFEVTLLASVMWAKENGFDFFEKPEPAPEEFFTIWNDASSSPARYPIEINGVDKVKNAQLCLIG